MDSGLLAEAVDAVENYEHLAAGNSARVKLRQPLVLRQLQSDSGVLFDIEDDDDCFGDDEEEEIFTAGETWSSMFRITGGAKDDEVSLGGSHFDADSYINSSFSEMEEQMVDLKEDGSVKKLIIRPGTGKIIPERCKIFFHYMSLAEGCLEPFDTTLLRKFPCVADLREKGSGLLRGLEIAIRSMELHEVASFIVAPELGYGKIGCPPRVPPNSKILFVVEALQYIDEELLSTPLYMTLEERAKLPFAVILEEVDKLCADGNGHYINGSFQLAIRKYRKARSMLEDYSTQNQADDEKRSLGLRRLCINIAHNYLKLEKAPQACVACKLGLKECGDGDKDTSVALLWRFASAKLILKDVDGAKYWIGKAVRLDPGDENVKRVQAEVAAEEKVQEKGLSAMCKRMFGGKEKETSSKPKKTASISSTNLVTSNPDSRSVQASNLNDCVLELTEFCLE